MRLIDFLSGEERTQLMVRFDDPSFPLYVKSLLNKEVDPVQHGRWNNHEVACLIADLFGDPCACNFNGIDDWLPTYCDFSSTCCPHPDGVACWEQYLKHLDKRHDEVSE